MSVNTAQFPDQVWDGSTPTKTSRQDDKAADFETVDQLTAEIIAVQQAAFNSGPSVAGNGAAAASGNLATETRNGVHKTTLTLTNVKVNIASSAIGFGSTKVYDLPEGLIHILGAVMDLTLTVPGVEISSTAAVVAALGTVAAADDATLTSTEANIIPSTAYTLVANTKHAVGVSTGAATFDGHATPIDVLLNMAVPDADRSDNAEDITVNGTIQLTWVNLGDA